MLSDALADTVVMIDRYTASFPEAYGRMAERIRAVREEIDNLRNELDAYPVIVAQERMLRAPGAPKCAAEFGSDGDFEK